MGGRCGINRALCLRLFLFVIVVPERWPGTRGALKILGSFQILSSFTCGYHLLLSQLTQVANLQRKISKVLLSLTTHTNHTEHHTETTLVVCSRDYVQHGIIWGFLQWLEQHGDLGAQSQWVRNPYFAHEKCINNVFQQLIKPLDQTVHLWMINTSVNQMNP